MNHLVHKKEVIKHINQSLTNQERGFVEDLKNKKMSATQAVKNNYNVTTDASARSLASQKMKAPQILMALQEHVALAESAIVGTIRDWKDSDNTRKREISTQNAQYLHDKIYGKATTRVEIQNTTVSISINLTGDGDTPPPEMLVNDDDNA